MKIGVGVIIMRGDQVLLGKRKSSHGQGEWAFPGGHPGSGEFVLDTARREAYEETGLTLAHLKLGPYTEDLFPSGKHYLTCFVHAYSATGTPQNREPEKCEGWSWHAWDQLPEPLFLPIVNLKRQGYRPPFLSET